MNAKQLKKILQSHYGEEFIRPTQRELGVDQATVYRWLAGHRIPGPVVAWAREIQKQIDAAKQAAE